MLYVEVKCISSNIKQVIFIYILTCSVVVLSKVTPSTTELVGCRRPKLNLINEIVLWTNI
jgi:hypothetical protein